MRPRLSVWKLALVLSAALIAYVGLAGYMTGATASPKSPTPLALQRASLPWTGGDRLSVVTWNLGYGGLGAGADFFADGGRAYLPPSRRAVLESRQAIADLLGRSDADIILNQEMARASVVNLWVDLKTAVDAALPGYGRIFRPDFQTRLLPPPLRIQNGLAVYVRQGLRRAETWPLPDDGDPYDGFLRRRYGAVATYVDGPGGCWVFVNVHTSAFDEGAGLRRRQVASILARAQAEHAAGRRVVLGGDFNMRLVRTDFTHTTEQRHLFWVHDFPADLLPAGWRIVADASIPSVRTNERPYRAGENYTTVIDGFIVSPGVKAASVSGMNLGFRHSDHQPVRAVFEPESTPGQGC